MKTWIFIFVTILFAACAKEDDLVPSEIRNWYVITPSDNMDEVDTKIYDLYQKYGIAVFYEDTIGSEDRGWKDENGNPKLYYEVLNLGYDISVGTNVIGNSFEANPLDVSTPEQKERMLPLLELMDNTLFSWIENAEVFIPAVLIVEDMRKSFTNTFEGYPQYVYRGMSALGFAINSYDLPNVNVDSLIQRTFLQQVCYGALQDKLEMFQLLATSALEEFGISKDKASNCWGVAVDDLVEDYTHARNNLELMDKNIATYEGYVAQLAEIEEALQDETLTEEERAKLEADSTLTQSFVNTYKSIIENYEENYEEYKAIVIAYDPRNFGFIDYVKGSGVNSNSYYFPTEEEDFNAYLEALWEYDDDEFMELHRDYIDVYARYVLIRQTLEGLGFDIDRIKTDIANSK